MDPVKKMKEDFNKILDELLAKKCKNNQIFTREKYDELLIAIKLAKSKTRGKTPREYHQLKNYNVVNINGEDKLIFPASMRVFGANDKLYAQRDEMFDILHQTHITVNHGGRGKMITELQKTYKNITTELVMLYISLCETCKSKPIKQPKHLHTNRRNKPFSFENIPRYQIEIIDMSSESDNGFKYILFYKNLLTEYLQLRPLKTDNIDDFIPTLLDIFTIFGVPCILYSKMGNEFIVQLIFKLSEEWKSLRIIAGELTTLIKIVEKEGSESENIKNMLNSWRRMNQTCNWTKGLRFIQFTRNKTYIKGTRSSPHDATFNTVLSEGLSTFIPESASVNVNNEEELREFIDNPILDEDSFDCSYQNNDNSNANESFCEPTTKKQKTEDNVQLNTNFYEETNRLTEDNFPFPIQHSMGEAMFTTTTFDQVDIKQENDSN